MVIIKKTKKNLSIKNIVEIVFFKQYNLTLLQTLSRMIGNKIQL